MLKLPIDLIDLAERGLIPDIGIQLGIRRILAERVQMGRELGVEGRRRAHERFVAELRASPAAIHVDAANAQHYEVPARFFERCLGPRLKYSCCLYEPGVVTLAEAEEAMLARVVERARLEDGQTILDVGCGWGSLSLYLAERFPNAKIVGVSNSATQRTFILQRAAERGLDNVEIRTVDINALELAPESFDRIVSVEMLEHARNYQLIFQRFASWLRADGLCFLHVFVHREQAYAFETEGATNWLGRWFFTGGIMPSEELFLHFQDDLRVEQRWAVNGRHYARTAQHWLANLDAHREELLALFAEQHGPEEARRWLGRWRMFFLSCEGLWGYGSGDEWYVAHTLLSKRRR